MNPVMILFLGAAVAVGASANLMQALTAGIAVLIVMALSNVILSALKGLFADCKFAATLIVVAGVTSVVGMFLNAFMYASYNAVAVYVSCISVNLLVYAGVEKDLVTVAKAGLTFCASICVIGAVRELFGAGAIAGVKIDFLASHTVNVLNNPAGGLLILAFVMAILNKKGTKACLNCEFLAKVFNNKKGGNE